MDRTRVEALADVELKRFVNDRPGSMQAIAPRHPHYAARRPDVVDGRAARPSAAVGVAWAGSRFWDIDGHEYVDMYVADMSAFCGHAPAPPVAGQERAHRQVLVTFRWPGTNSDVVAVVVIAAPPGTAGSRSPGTTQIIDPVPSSRRRSWHYRSVASLDQQQMSASPSVV
jgi:hypothetical protein